MRLLIKVALITGGSRGIGLATAQALLAQGASVAITGTQDSTLSAGRNDLIRAAAEDRVLAIRADVRNYDEVEAALGRVSSTFGGLDVLASTSIDACRATDASIPFSSATSSASASNITTRFPAAPVG